MIDETFTKQFNLDLRNFNYKNSHTTELAYWLEQYNTSDDKKCICGYSDKYLCARNLQRSISLRAIEARKKRELKC